MPDPDSQDLAEELIEIEDRWGAHNYRPLDVVIDHASGVWAYDIDCKRYMDCLSAYSALNQGHCHPRILQALQEQAARVTLTSRAFRNDQLPRFVEELARLCGMEMVLPMNTGADTILLASGSALGSALAWRSDRQVSELLARAERCGAQLMTRTMAFGIYDHNLVCARETVPPP